jgi:hypothetical protein
VVLHIPFRHGVRDALKTQDPHQPIENRTGVVVLDRGNDAIFCSISAKVIDPRGLARNPADLTNEGPGAPSA